MRGVEYVNSAGLGVLVRTADSSEGRLVTMVGVRSRVRVMFEMLGLSAFFHVFNTDDDAIRALLNGTLSDDGPSGGGVDVESISLRGRISAPPAPRSTAPRQQDADRERAEPADAKSKAKEEARSERETVDRSVVTVAPGAPAPPPPPAEPEPVSAEEQPESESITPDAPDAENRRTRGIAPPPPSVEISFGASISADIADLSKEDAAEDAAPSTGESRKPGEPNAKLAAEGGEALDEDFDFADEPVAASSDETGRADDADGLDEFAAADSDNDEFGDEEEEAAGDLDIDALADSRGPADLADEVNEADDTGVALGGIGGMTAGAGDKGGYGGGGAGSSMAPAPMPAAPPAPMPDLPVQQASEPVVGGDQWKDVARDDSPTGALAVPELKRRRSAAGGKKEAAAAPKPAKARKRSAPEPDTRDEPAELAASSVAPANAASPASTASPAKPKPVAGETLARKTTVRHWSQMNPNKNFPLLVMLTKPEIKIAAPTERKVQQTVGKERLEVKAAQPFVEIVPRFPGCFCVPDRARVDVTPEKVEVPFWITPHAVGNLQDAKVEVWYEGKLLDTIACPAKVKKPTLAMVAALLGGIAPVFFGAFEVATGTSAQEQVGESFRYGIPELAQSAGGLQNLGLYAGAALLGLAAVGWFFARPRRKQNPSESFFDVKLEPEQDA